jgi:signal transduction histidine kinase
MAADRNARQETWGFTRRLTQLIRRLVRSRDRAASHATLAPRGPSSRIDLGDLAVAQLVHDLRNQLTVIIASADNLAAVVEDSQDARQQLTDLQHSAERAAVLAREILLAARPRFANRRPIDLNQVVRAVGEMLSRIMGPGIRVRLQVSPDPVQVSAEVVELERIVINLALNARDAMGGDGVLTITTAVVDTSSQPIDGIVPGRYVRLTVSDTGSGLTPEVRARMFEPFFSTKEAGTGLGLSSVAFTARQLLGTVTVESEPGRGTSVSVILPFAAMTFTPQRSLP